jgi:hypothetical protein
VGPEGILSIPPSFIGVNKAILIGTVNLPRVRDTVGLHDIARAYLRNDTRLVTPLHAALRLRGAQITPYAVVFVLSLGFICMEPTVEFAQIFDHSVAVAVCNATHHL